MAGQLSGSGSRFVFDYRGADTAIAINRLLRRGASVGLRDSRVYVSGVGGDTMDETARELGLEVAASDVDTAERRPVLRLPRIAGISSANSPRSGRGFSAMVHSAGG